MPIPVPVTWYWSVRNDRVAVERVTVFPPAAAGPASATAHAQSAAPRTATRIGRRLTPLTPAVKSPVLFCNPNIVLLLRSPIACRDLVLEKLPPGDRAVVRGADIRSVKLETQPARAPAESTSADYLGLL